MVQVRTWTSAIQITSWPQPARSYRTPKDLVTSPEYFYVNQNLLVWSYQRSWWVHCCVPVIRLRLEAKRKSTKGTFLPGDFCTFLKLYNRLDEICMHRYCLTGALQLKNSWDIFSINDAFFNSTAILIKYEKGCCFHSKTKKKQITISCFIVEKYITFWPI